MNGRVTDLDSNSLAVDRRDAVPLYHQIYLALRDEIISGRRAYGTPVPTEHELSETHGVSRITARRALDELAQHRLVERRRRLGTRVIFKSPTKPIEANIDQAVESLLAFGRNTRVRVVEISAEPADQAVGEALHLAAGEAIVRAVRIRELDGEPLGQVVSFVPARLGHLITPRNLTSMPMLAVLRSEGHAIASAQQTISALVAGPGLAATLGIEPRAPVLRVERVVIDTAGTPLLLTIAHYRADRYRISLDLHGPA